MTLDTHSLLTELATTRPIFHSEADFQHAFAWLIHQRWPQCAMRLEYPAATTSGMFYLDLFGWIGESRFAVELKYKTRALEVVVGSETFRLKSHAAQDLGRYDFLKDVQRLEAVVAAGVADEAVAILLTNDSAYWKEAARSATAYESFRLDQARRVTGALRWGPSAGAGTMKNREAEIVLEGGYDVEWREYSEVSSGSYGTFRTVAFSIGDS